MYHADRKEHILEADNELILARSNALIMSKTRLNLLANKLVALALTRIQTEGSKDDSKLIARIYPGEITRLIGHKSNIYRELKNSSALMVGQSIVVEDGRGNFKAFTYIHKSIYQNGVLSIEFDDEIKPHLFELQRNYTTIRLSALTGFEKDSSFRIYEVLYKDLYKSDPNVNDGTVTIVYPLNEFRFMIGCANINEDGVQAYLTRNKVVDWDYVFETVSKEKKYVAWTDFKRYIIEPAQKELAEKSDICFDFKGERVKSNKIGKIVFYLRPNKPNKKEASKMKQRESIIEERSATYLRVEEPEDRRRALHRDFVGHNGLTAFDLSNLLEKANQDESLVRKAIEAADQQPYVRNYVGWLVSYIQTGGYETIEVMDGSKERAEEVSTIMHSIRSDKAKLKMWERTKNKPDFDRFLQDICMPLKVFEEDVPDVAERLQIYSEWRLGES